MEAMKGLIWDLVCLQRVLSYREREEVSARDGPRDYEFLLITRLLSCSTPEGSTSQVCEQGLRKTLYQKIVAASPDGWMSSGQISREGERNVWCAVTLGQ